MYCCCYVELLNGEGYHVCLNPGPYFLLPGLLHRHNMGSQILLRSMAIEKSYILHAAHVYIHSRQYLYSAENTEAHHHSWFPIKLHYKITLMNQGLKESDMQSYKNIERVKKTKDPIRRRLLTK